MTDQQMQQKYMEYQMLEQKKKQLQEHFQAIQEQIEQVGNVAEQMDEIMNVESGTETIVPLASGIFAKAKIQDTQKLIVNIGANTCVEKTPSQVKEMLARQIDEMKKIHDKIDGDLRTIEIQSQSLTKEIQG